MNFNSILLYVSEWLGVVAVIWLVRLSTRLKVKPVGFKYAAREGYVSLGLFVSILALAYFFFTRVSQAPDALGLLWQRLVVDGIALAIFGLALLGRGQPLRSAGWGRATLSAALRLGLALAFLTIFLRGKVFSIINGVTAQAGLALLACLGIGLAEETIFRGYIQSRLCFWLGERWGWLATAGLFLVWQAPRLAADPANLPLNLLVVTVQGLVLGWLAQTSGNVLAPALYRAISEWVGFLS
ncbi:MAG: CPBP family intramembrane glutamic endopeptidase [Anaerolineaceae bacterium]